DRRAPARRRLEVPERRHVHPRLRRDGGGSRGRRQLVVGEPPGLRPGSPQAIVAAGYDKIAERYLAWSGDRPSAARRRALDLALGAIPTGAEVLELGCGSGRPMTAALANGRRVTGIDI